MENYLENNVIWATVRGCGGYAVSNQGNVKNVKTGRVLKPFPNSTDPKKAYLQVTLGANNYLVRVMDAFGRKPKGRYQIDHIDNNKRNNALANLQWLTPSLKYKALWRKRYYLKPRMAK